MAYLEHWGVIGHEWAVRSLRQHMAHDRVRHAYLFTGPQGVGRRTLALRFAKALNCIRPPVPGEFCGECRACTHIEAMQHPDLQVVQAEREGGTLKVEQVRELQSSLALHPYEARYRIALLLRVEEAHVSAMNALLKTLEEPPPRVLLLLTAESAESLLPTIVSRCEVLRLRPSPVDAVKRRLLSDWEMDDGQAEMVARLSAGRPGYALQLAQNPELLEQRTAWLEDLERLLQAGRVERFAWAEPFVKNKDLLYKILVVWLSYWRDVLLMAGGASAPITNLDYQESIEHLAKRIGLLEARRVTRAVENTLALISRNVNARVAAETLMLDLPKG